MEHFYTNERNHQILISLLKAHNIKRIVVSPGSGNSVFVGSIQHDPFFEIFSCVDERSAAYLACGLALESNEPVAINCTGATAARNYMSAATEAYYSKLPILIVTSSQSSYGLGQLIAQITDRSSPPTDTCRISVELPICNTEKEEWYCEIQANRALLDLKRHGGGPVHINLITSYSYNEKTVLTQKELPQTRVIHRVAEDKDFPTIEGQKIAVFVGSHKKWSSALVEAVERFCERHNAVVLCDHTSNYQGKYRIPYALKINQASLNKANIPAYQVDLLIHIGEVTGEEGASRMIRSKETWRVSEDGEIRDYFRNLTYVFEMSETEFFSYYSSQSGVNDVSFYHQCLNDYKELLQLSKTRLESMPFSNVWIAASTAPLIPEDSSVVLSILNTLRTWNYAEFKKKVNVYSPVGGFGIDGASSLLLGASLTCPSRLFYGVTGDLAFFYDLNVLGNRHVGNNVRILLINNGMGFEFKKCYALAYRLMGDDVEPFVSAAGHFGNKSSLLVKHFSEDLGFEYLSASNKEEFMSVLSRFTCPDITDKPMLLECFVEPEDESSALNMIHNR